MPGLSRRISLMGLLETEVEIGGIPERVAGTAVAVVAVVLVLLVLGG